MYVSRSSEVRGRTETPVQTSQTSGAFDAVGTAGRETSDAQPRAELNVCVNVQSETDSARRRHENAEG